MQDQIILIVEDNAAIGEALADILQDEGYGTAFAKEGGEALEYLRREGCPSLVLLDLVMPGMDGATFRKRQLEDLALASVPVLVITADKRRDADYYANLADGYLWKPFSIDLLFEKISELIRSSSDNLAPCQGRRSRRSPLGHDPRPGGLYQKVA